MAQSQDLGFHLVLAPVVNGLVNLFHDVVEVEGFLNKGSPGQTHDLIKNLSPVDHDDSLQVGVLFQAGYQELLGVGQVQVGDDQVKSGLLHLFHGLFHIFNRLEFKTDKFDDRAEKIAGAVILVKN